MKKLVNKGRERKFRVYHKLNDGRWYCYHVNAISTNNDGVVEKVFIGDDEGIKLDKKTVLVEYIGRKDEKGREIYEGDIVKAEHGWGGPPSKIPKGKETVEVLHVVEWVETNLEIGWQMREINFEEAGGYKNVYGDWYRKPPELGMGEVVGDIYRNSKLLKKKKVK